ncbi:MAG: ABC transporter substrate-binding protein [Oscillospiraceae bacterium]|nr:ABC transporter substrate-binding protein [Oscillospiraceae bacterium]MBR3949638.1 ABC transporter substrate-binding protein [Oscillospiraceae bacterium]
MKKRILIILLTLLLLTGCASAPAVSEGMTLTDDLGRSVTVNQPQRVACLLGSYAQIWQLAGGQVGATADDAWDDLALALPEDCVNLGNTKELSLEALLESQPDFILASSNTRQQLQWRETLEATGIPTYYCNVSGFDSYLKLLDICTDLTGRKDLYETYGLEVQRQVEAVLEQAEDRGTNPTVLCMRASASMVTVKNSQDNVLGEMLKDLGCVNIADSDASLLENLSLERILEADPEYIFLVQRGDDEAGMRAYVKTLMEENPAWQQLTAVKEGRLYFMDKNLYNLKPNHRWGEAYEQLEEILEHE